MDLLVKEVRVDFFAFFGENIIHYVYVMWVNGFRVEIAHTTCGY